MLQKSAIDRGHRRAPVLILHAAASSYDIMTQHQISAHHILLQPLKVRCILTLIAILFHIVPRSGVWINTSSGQDRRVQQREGGMVTCHSVHTTHADVVSA